MDLAAAARSNDAFKRVVRTTLHTQSTVMRLLPGTEIGDEIHAGYDQIVVVVSGNGTIVRNGVEVGVGPTSTVQIAGGDRHNVKNVHPRNHLLLVVLYSPPKFPDDGVYWTREEAEGAPPRT